MGEAVFKGLQKTKSKNAYVIWSDQIYLKDKIIKDTINKFIKKNLFYFPIKKIIIYIHKLYLIVIINFMIFYNLESKNLKIKKDFLIVVFLL